MNAPKDRIARFFDKDSAEYLKHKYDSDRGLSYMALRRQKSAEILARHVIPAFTERFRFLDCGCGPGILLDVLAGYRIGYWGLDISQEMLKLASRRIDAGPSKLIEEHFVRGDVEKLPFASDSFDAAASLGVIEYVHDDNQLLSELHRVLRPNAHLLIAVTNRASYNLALERPLNWMRRHRHLAALLNAVKLRLRLGEFRHAEFMKRRHLPNAFESTLDSHGFKVLVSTSWGFNALPHPLHFLCPDRWNRLTNAAYENSRSAFVKRLGEGHIVLCRRAPSADAQ